ncbi:uncharacterized protein LOC142162158 [Nicotiana tabacum]|uniref:Uncharacterized protein LOC142162158 n=1 Tax=Nicotiana tabacum TaxID=4097 RepID=A0AC58RPC5_TOBAC
MGGKVDVSVNKTKGPRTFRLSGRSEMNNELHAEIVNDLKQMLDDNNVLAKSFRMVAALIVGDFEQTRSDRDIIVESQSGQLQRINELNASYLGLQYPLLFSYGENGYREDIPLNDIDDSTGGRKCVSTREYLSYKIQERKDKVPTIVSARRLFQQFLVDGYTMMESSRLRFIRLHQKQLRAHFYKGLQDAVLHGNIEPSSQGQRVILSSSFTGGARYMLQNYQDAMAICKWVGYPDLFITITCNPKWSKIIIFVESRGLSPEDRPDILTRFLMIKDLRDNKVFGEVKAVEFQKRGLPHAHILLFLRNKYPNVADIDGIISAELPDKKVDPHDYNVVTNFMMHGPCGAARKSSPCMQNGRCTKHFPKKFVSSTTIDEDGYPIYRRRDDGRTAKRVGIELDNRKKIDLAEFPLKFVWKQNLKRWEKRTSAFSIGRIFFVPPGSGEQYYIRLLLNVIKGPKSYDELKRINGCDHETFRDACYALGLLDDDKEYVDAIMEASNWGMTSYLRQLFAMLLLSNLMSRRERVWQATWHLLSEDILHEERTILDHPAHSRFVIPLNLTEDSTCNIKQGTPLANLIVKAKLIIWDEAPMMHRYCFEVLDKTLRDILRFKDASNLDRPFGGKTIVLGGDFRQILHVIPKGTRQGNEIGTHLDELRVFSDWILGIGDGMVGTSVDGYEKVQIPDDLLIKQSDNLISAIVESTYLDFKSRCSDIGYLQQRAILAPTLDMVESINEYMISLNESSEKSYLSSDTICSSDHTYSALEHIHTPEFLNTIKCSGVPNHALTLKVGIPVMLLRNIDQTAGLCNGTRLIITKLGNQVIEAKVLSGQMAGQKVFISRMTLTLSDARIPFKFQRRQFPIVVSFAMTKNKSQGQLLSHVGLF